MNLSFSGSLQRQLTEVTDDILSSSFPLTSSSSSSRSSFSLSSSEVLVLVSNFFLSNSDTTLVTITWSLMDPAEEFLVLAEEVKDASLWVEQFLVRGKDTMLEALELSRERRGLR